MAIYERPETRALASSDFARWCEEQARALRQNRWEALDTEDVADELESMSRAERYQLEAELAIVLMHMLKETHQPGKRSKSWAYSIKEHARRVVRRLADSPSLKFRWDETLAEAYESARIQAAGETNLPLDTFAGDLSDDFMLRLDEALAEAERARQRRRKS